MSRRATGTPRSGPRRLSFCPSAASRRITGSREGFSTLDGLRSWSDQPINAPIATTARGTQTRTPLKGRLDDGQSDCALGARTPVWEPLRITSIGRSFLVCGTPGERPQFPRRPRGLNDFAGRSILGPGAGRRRCHQPVVSCPCTPGEANTFGFSIEGEMCPGAESLRPFNSRITEVAVQ
jgi:hypothetical protein